MESSSNYNWPETSNFNYKVNLPLLQLYDEQLAQNVYFIVLGDTTDTTQYSIWKITNSDLESDNSTDVIPIWARFTLPLHGTIQPTLLDYQMVEDNCLLLLTKDQNNKFVWRIRIDSYREIPYPCYVEPFYSYLNTTQQPGDLSNRLFVMKRITQDNTFDPHVYIYGENIYSISPTLSYLSLDRSTSQISKIYTILTFLKILI